MMIDIEGYIDPYNDFLHVDPRSLILPYIGVKHHSFRRFGFSFMNTIMFIP